MGECEVKIKLIAHPTFMLSCVSREKNLSISVLDRAMELIEASIKSKGGEFEVKSRPEIAGEDGDDDKEESSSDSDSDGGSSGDAENQDETMGDLDEAQMKE